MHFHQIELGSDLSAPFCINTRKKETSIITKVLNLLSQDTMMAVKPLPPAVLVDIVWLAPQTMMKPAIPQMAPDSAMVRRITFFTLIPAYLAVFSLSPINCDLIALLAVFQVNEHGCSQSQHDHQIPAVVKANSLGIQPPWVEELMVPTELEPFGFSQKIMQYVITWVAT